MRSMNKSSILNNFCKLSYSQSASPSPSSSKLRFCSESSHHQLKREGKYAGETVHEGDNKGYIADEIVGGNEASEMGEKAKKSTDKSMAYAQRLGSQELKIMYDDDHQAAAAVDVEAEWNAGKDTVFGDDSDKQQVDKESMERVAKNPGGKPIDEDQEMHI